MSSIATPPVTQRRYTVDQHESMGYPMVPIGRTIGEQVVDDGDTRIVNYDSIGWQIQQVKAEERKIPSTILYDGYYGLMWQWKEAGFPDDGEVSFSRYNFLQAIGWVSNGRNTSGGKLTKPSGRHYSQLRDVCHTLMFTAYVRDLPGRNQGFTVLGNYDLVDDQPGPRGMGEDLPKRSRVVFNNEFVKRLKTQGPMVTMDLDLYLSLSTGAPRVLFRILSWMQHHGIDHMPLEPFFNRMGSVQKSYLPSVGRKLLDTAGAELIARNVLAAPPQYEKVDGEWHVVFPFGDPEKARYEDEVLVREAVMCGVNPSVAQELLVAHRSRFEEVMACVAAGAWRERANLPGAIHQWTRRSDYDLPTELVEGAMVLTNETDMYRAWIAKQQEAGIRRRGIDMEALGREVMASLRNRGVDRPRPILVQGLTRMRLNHLLDLPSFEWYQQRLRAGALEQEDRPIMG